MSRAMRKLNFCLCENKGADQLRSNCEAELISAFVFATWIIQSLFFLNSKFQASSHLQWLHRPVCVRPGRDPEDQFSHVVARTLAPHTRKLQKPCVCIQMECPVNVHLMACFMQIHRF